MEIKAKAKHIKISPRKVRLVVDVVRGMVVDKALDQLRFVNKKATLPVRKLIESGIANAEHNYELEKNNLFVKEIRVDEGVTMKRWMPRAYGRATPIRKRTSHISLVLSEINDSGEKKARKVEAEKPVKLDEIGKEPIKTTGKKKKEVVEKKKEETAEAKVEDKGKDGRHGHAKIEGGSHKGFAKGIFRRKSG